MRYTLKCDNCRTEEFIDAPITEGPPQDLPCAFCDEGKMCNQLGTNFILKGAGWPSKTFKAEREGQDGRAVEMMEEGTRQKKNAKRVSQEVLDARRKGRAHWSEYQQKYPDKVRQYKDNMAHGIKGE